MPANADMRIPPGRASHASMPANADFQAPRDHRAPGQGDTDFAMLGRYLREDTIRTLELHPSVTASEISQALDLLADLEVFGVREGILVEL